jgi:hypothetical protein
MKKVTLTDLNGKEIEVYFADDKTAEGATHSDEYKVKTEDVPSDKDWADMTGGDSMAGYTNQYKDPDHPLNKHDEGQTYWMSGDEKYPLGEQDVNEGSAGEGAHKSFYEKLNKKWVNKIKGLEEPQSQIKIDDTIPSDFIDTLELRPQSIYRVAGLHGPAIAVLLAKFVGSFATTVPDGNKILLQMKRHGTVFYVEEGSLMKATDLEVQLYLEESK